MTKTSWIVRGVTLGLIALGILLMGVPFPGRGRTVSWAVVWDASASMGEPDGPVSRWARARSAWKKVQSRNQQIPHYLLGLDWEKADDLTLDTVRPIKPGCSGRVLMQALGSNPPDAVLLFSDGKWSDNADGLGVPLFVVGVGSEETAADLAVESIQSPPVAFSGAPATVSARLIARGPVRTASVSLFVGGRRVDGRVVEVSDGAAPVSFQWTPAREGGVSGEIRIDPAAGETRLGNNIRRFVVDVQRDRVRTLYISGRPGAHTNFLRAQLKNDPAVELVSFVVLRDPEDALGYGDRDLSLIPFPTSQELVAQLPTFSAVILEDWTALRFALGTSFMGALEEWVRRGGGVLFVEDPPSPLPLSPWMGESTVSGPERFTLIANDGSHPLLSLGDAKENRWDRMGVLEGSGFFPEKLKPGARILATEPGGRPVLAELSLDRGRSLGLANRTSWRWAMEGGRRGEGPGDYQRFWENVIRWLASSPGAGTVRMDRPTGVLSAGETVLLTVHVPVKGRPSLRLYARALGGSRVSVPIRAGDRPGRYVGSFTPPAPGPYEFSVWVEKSEADHFWVDISSGWDEQIDLRPDPARLADRARTSGGEFVSAADFNRRVWSRWNRQMRKNVSTSSLSTLFLLPGLIALVAEWVWRRRRGLV